MDKQLYEMSDEELMNIDLSSYQSEEPVNEEVAETTEQTEELTDETSDIEPTNTANESDEQEVTEQAEVVDTESTTDTDTEQPNDEVDYKTFWEELTKPFKANGKEIQITDPKDMITLMQKGVDYSKKNEELKPQRAVIKTLQKHGLLDNDKLAYLIDLHNKDPKAIAKLVKESEIDLYSFDTEIANEYAPQQVISTPSDLDTIVDELYQEESFRNILTHMTSEWDTKSKEILANNPQVLYTFNEQAKSGVYQKIIDVIEHERMLGRMTNMSFIDAYIAVESQMLKQPETQPQQQSFTGTRPKAEVNASNHNNNKLRAGTPNKGNNNNTNMDLDTLAKMSDTELAEYLSQLE